MTQLTPFTSESVTEGHPDKICDRISDAILDAILMQDPKARVAVETVVTTGLVHVVGEVTTEAYVEIPKIVRDEVIAVGYDHSDKGFDGHSCGISVSIGQQSPDIAQSVTVSKEAREEGADDPRQMQGAGDQGMMFGYATDETPDLMPAPVWLAHRLAEKLTEVRKDGTVTGIYPDGKTQVTLLYDQDNNPVAIDTIVVSTQHSVDWDQEDLKEAIESSVIVPVLEETNLGLDTSKTRIMVNPSGRFVVGGPAGDAGLTGRKIIVDTYGGAAPHGGGAFSGKDPSKVDRSAAYAARWIAKNIVAAGLAKRCQVQLAYAIGAAEPVSVRIDTFGTSQYSQAALVKAVNTVFDLRPLGIIEELHLLDNEKVRFIDTAAYGHFGRDKFPWEKTDRTEQLKAAIKE